MLPGKRPVPAATFCSSPRLQKSPLAKMSLGHDGGPQQTSRRCHYDMHWHIRQQRAHRRLVAERVQETGPLQRRQDARGDASADENSTRRQGAQGEVPGLAAVRGYKERQRFMTPLASPLHPRGADGRRQVQVLSYRQTRLFLMRELVQVDQAWAAQDVLDRGAPIPPPQEPHQLVFPWHARREVSVPGLGGTRQRPAPDADQLR